MQSIDYKALGLKVGLETHQQLKTQKKLFCHCPAELTDQPHDLEILRHMRPTLSELGEYDGTALMEFKTKKEVIYQLFYDRTCTYEMDDTPPFPVNLQALDVAIELCLLFNCALVDEVHISRKQYLDGSIPTGFQRTAIVGLSGWFPLNGKKIHVIQMSLEEDACREVKDKGHRITFKTDRLGIPLIEVVTAPDMETPQEAALAARIVGKTLRVSGKVRRGIGSVRQDVNVSIKGGTRVELKGIHQIGYIEDLVHNEAIRQYNLLRIKDLLRGRGITDKTIKSEQKDLTDLFKRLEFAPYRTAVQNGLKVGGIKLEGWGGILNEDTQPGKPFSYELEGRIRVIACIDEPPILLHTQQNGIYELSEKDLRAVNELFKSRPTDVVVLVCGTEADIQTALNEILIRATDATMGVPNETRQSLKNGFTDFERILPGPDRMYPDTDSPPTRITPERVERITSQMNPQPWERERRYRELGLSEEIIPHLVISERANLFARITADLKVKPTIVAVTLTQILKALKRKNLPVESISDNQIYEMCQFLEKRRFFKEIIPDILIALCHGKSVEEALEVLEIEPFNPSRLSSFLKHLLKYNPKILEISEPGKRLRYTMGLAMQQLRGRVEARKLRESITAM